MNPYRFPRLAIPLFGLMYFLLALPSVHADNELLDISLVANLTGDEQGSVPRVLTPFNGKLYFSADVDGRELWMSDGTEAGTEQVIAIRPSSSFGSNPSDLTVAGDQLFFSANDPDLGSSLWVSDGTTEGTNILPINSLGGSPAHITAVGERVFFRANDGNSGLELWVSDGTIAGTQLVEDLRPGANSNPTRLQALGDKLFFRADDGNTGAEPWVYDDNDGSISLLKDINPGEDGSQPHSFTPFGERILFNADDGTGQTNREPWISDGTPAGTMMLKDIHPDGGSNPLNYQVVGDRVFFSAWTPETGRELWVTDGTAEGTHLVANINGNASDSLSTGQGTVAFDNQLFNVADDDIHGSELWKSDGTAAGTQMVRDINPGSSSGLFSNVTPVEFAGRLYFGATDGSAGRELWTTDGTEAGTFMVKDLWIGPSDSSPEFFTVVGEQLFFVATSATSGRELHVAVLSGPEPTIFRDRFEDLPAAE